MQEKRDAKKQGKKADVQQPQVRMLQVPKAMLDQYNAMNTQGLQIAVQLMELLVQRAEMEKQIDMLVQTVANTKKAMEEQASAITDVLGIIGKPGKHWRLNTQLGVVEILDPSIPLPASKSDASKENSSSHGTGSKEEEGSG